MAYTRNGTNYTPNFSTPSPFVILKPIEQQDTVGMISYTYPDPMDAIKDNSNKFYGNFRTYTGTQKVINNTIVYEDTAELTVWQNFPISINDRIYNPLNGTTYSIITVPENINQKGIYNVFKVRAIKTNG